MNFIIQAIAAFLSGLLGAMGLGGGGILIIYLTLFEGYEQITAQGINLLFFIPSAVIAVIYYIKKKLIDFKAIIFMILSGIPGVLLGCLMSSVISSDILGKLFAILLLIMGIRQLINHN